MRVSCCKMMRVSCKMIRVRYRMMRMSCKMMRVWYRMMRVSCCKMMRVSCKTPNPSWVRGVVLGIGREACSPPSAWVRAPNPSFLSFLPWFRENRP